MNCHEFENLVVDLARGEVTDSLAGTRCWAHAANCPRCAERLLDQEKLTAGLEALITHTDVRPAPERVEALLRREFRDHFARNEARIASRPSTWNPPYPIWMSGSRWAWAVASAVLLATLAGIIAAKYRSKLPTENTVQNMHVSKATESRPAIAKNNPPTPTASREHSTARGSGENSVSLSHKRAGGKNKSRTPARPTFRSTAHDELATNFYPLPYGSGLPLDEGWEIVRISLPRSALATLGVPEAGEQSSIATIKADLVLGEDGLARAIRFVE